jgi:hypothetical protein
VFHLKMEWGFEQFLEIRLGILKNNKNFIEVLFVRWVRYLNNVHNIYVLQSSKQRNLSQNSLSVNKIVENLRNSFYSNFFASFSTFRLNHRPVRTYTDLLDDFVFLSTEFPVVEVLSWYLLTLILVGHRLFFCSNKKFNTNRIDS